MKKGQREYTKHFIILFILILSTILLCCKDYFPNILHTIFFFITFTYAWIFIFGVFFKLGPMKYIAELMADDQDEELKRAQQPWK